MPLKLSHSSVQNYNDCRMKYRLMNVQGIKRRGIIIPFITGRAVHAYQQALREGLSPEQCELALLKEFDIPEQQVAMLSRDDQNKLDVEKYRSLAMMQSYTSAYASDSTQYSKWITESHIEIPLIDDVVYHGYIDCLTQDVAGDWWIFETKTASAGTVNAEYFERVKIDSQVAGYMELAKAKLGFYPRGIVYDVILKTQHSRKQGESNGSFINRLRNLYVNEWKTRGLFERHEVEVGSNTIKRWNSDIRTIAKEIKTLIDNKEKNWTRNTGHCLGKFGACPMFNICTTGRMNKLLYEKRN